MEGTTVAPTMEKTGKEMKEPPEDLEKTFRVPPGNEPEGFLTRTEVQHIIIKYWKKLHPKKQNKCLVTASRLGDVYQILGPLRGDSSFQNPQLRFWARATFYLPATATGPGDVLKRPPRSHQCGRQRPQGGVLEDGHNTGQAQDEDPVDVSRMVPVVTAEEIYDRVTTAHMQTNHGGRDKTAALAREGIYGIPKEIVSLYVAACPTCDAKRKRPATVTATAATTRRRAATRANRRRAARMPSPASVPPPVAEASLAAALAPAAPAPAAAGPAMEPGFSNLSFSASLTAEDFPMSWDPILDLSAAVVAAATEEEPSGAAPSTLSPTGDPTTADQMPVSMPVSDQFLVSPVLALAPAPAPLPVAAAALGFSLPALGFSLPSPAFAMTEEDWTFLASSADAPATGTGTEAPAAAAAAAAPTMELGSSAPWTAETEDWSPFAFSAPVALAATAYVSWPAPGDAPTSVEEAMPAEETTSVDDSSAAANFVVAHSTTDDVIGPDPIALFTTLG